MKRTVVESIYREDSKIPCFIKFSDGCVLVSDGVRPNGTFYKLYDPEKEDFKLNDKFELIAYKNHKTGNGFKNEYDDQGRIIHKVEFFENDVKREIFYEYKESGGKILKYNFKNKTVVEEYNENGYITKRTENDKIIYECVYDDRSNLTYYKHFEYGEAKAEYNEYGDIIYFEAKAYESFSMPYLTSEFPLNSDEE